MIAVVVQTRCAKVVSQPPREGQRGAEKRRDGRWHAPLDACDVSALHSFHWLFPAFDGVSGGERDTANGKR